MPSLTYVDNATGMQAGIASAETAMKVTSIRTTVRDPKIYTRDHKGSRHGFAHGHDPEVQIDVTGEISGSTGAVGSRFGDAITVANANSAKYGDTNTTYFGVAATGTFFFDGDIVVEETRGDGEPGWKTISFTVIACPDLND